MPYQGGSIMSGPPKVYVVLWGSQWGTQSTGVDGYLHFSGDPSGVAPKLQAFFAGLGTNSETWDGVMTQYCQGVSVGTSICPSNSTHVGYPTGGSLAGVWGDTGSASPNQASQSQLAAEAVVAAAHFGNTTSASNASSQYMIVSPHGANPDNYVNNGFCAWHSSTTSAYGKVAYTNLPYIPDAGFSCYANSVNSSGGGLDGVTVVGGHEYAETTTDPFSPEAWWDPTDNVSGGENADKCSLGLGYNGGNLSLATGSFAVQPTWSNDMNSGNGGCAMTHAIVGGGGGSASYTVSVSRAGTGSGIVTSSPSGINCGATCSASFAGGTSVALSATAGSGSTFAGWDGSCSGIGTCNLLANAAKSVTATFTSSGGGGGGPVPVTVSGALSGYYGSRGGFLLYHYGKNVPYTGTVTPNVSSQNMHFILEKKGIVTWKVVATADYALNSSSIAAVKATGFGQGRYRISCTYAGDATHAAGSSGLSYFRITS
jgi:serine protease